MNYLNKIIFITIIGILTACSSKEKQHIGQWEILMDDNIVGIIILNEDIVKLYSYRETECDTLIDLINESYPEPEQTVGQVTKIRCNSKDGWMKVILKFNDFLTGEICFEGINRDCGTFKKSNHLLSPKQSEYFQNTLYENTLSNDIYSGQIEFDLLSKSEFISKEASEMIIYIDSLTSILLLQYDVEIEDINCWHKLDSLTSIYTSTNFLTGFDSGFINREYNAYELENKLSNYLTLKSSDIDVSIIFPTFEIDSFVEYTKDGVRTFWMYNKFFHTSLGKSIIELNDIKIKIIQIERLIKEKEKTFANSK